MVVFQTTKLTNLLILGFLICFIVEGIGIIPSNFVFSFFLVFSIASFFILVKSKEDFSIQYNWITLGSLLYLLYLFYISLFSLNRQNSFEFTVYITSLFLLFFIFRQKWKEVEKYFFYIFLSLGSIFCLYSFLLPFTLNNNIFFFYPKSGYQYVYSLFGSNHLGEFLVFPILLCAHYYLHNKRNWVLPLAVFYFIFFLFSYSRAGYIGLLIGGALLGINSWSTITKKGKTIFFTILIFIILFIFFTSITIPLSKNLFFLAQYVPNFDKSTIDIREAYFLQALEGFLTHRYLGVGLGNFEYVSKMFSKTPGMWTTSSHNIFLDVLVETGTVGFLGFVYFALILLRAIRKYHTSIYAVLLLSWFTMLQFDYLGTMYSYLLLFPLFLVGLLSTNKTVNKKIINSRKFGIPVFILLAVFISIYIISGYFLNKKEYKLSREIYSLQTDAYKGEFKQGTILERKKILITYVQLFPGDYWGFQQQGRIYEQEGNMNLATKSYETSFWLDPFRDLGMGERIYNLKMSYEGKKSAKRFADKLFKKLNNDSEDQAFSYQYWVFINKFCQRVYNFHCPYTLE
jgi:O-antigen ligase